MQGFFYICQMVRNIFIILLIPFFVNAQSAFISGNDSICSNSVNQAEVKVSFSGGIEPYTFVYAIDGVNQPTPAPTTLNPYIIYTNQAGTYTLVSFSDANEIGSISGSAIVAVNQAPEASFITLTDSLSLLYPTVQLNDVSTGEIVSWDWDFGDGNTSTEQNPTHVVFLIS